MLLIEKHDANMSLILKTVYDVKRKYSLEYLEHFGMIISNICIIMEVNF